MIKDDPHADVMVGKREESQMRRMDLRAIRNAE